MPRKKSETEKEIRDVIKECKDLEVITNMDGGKLLIDGLSKDVKSELYQIFYNYQKMNHIELLASIATLKSRFETLQKFYKAKKNRKQAVKDLEELLLQEKDNAL